MGGCFDNNNVAIVCVCRGCHVGYILSACLFAFCVSSQQYSPAMYPPKKVEDSKSSCVYVLKLFINGSLHMGCVHTLHGLNAALLVEEMTEIGFSTLSSRRDSVSTRTCVCV